MTHKEAKLYVLRLKDDPGCYCQIVRMTPEPVRVGDNGWDVKTTYHYDPTVHED